MEADVVRLERLNNDGVVLESEIVPSIGTRTVVASTGGDPIFYRVVGVRGENEDSQSLAIQITCQYEWFFNDVPDGFGCPSAPVSRAQGAYQEFQRGFMFRLEWGGEDRVCGIQNNRDRYSCYDYDDYDESTVPEAPPSGYEPPGEDFEYVFYEELAIGGHWWEEIGWGRDEEDDDSLRVQPDDRGGIIVDLPDEGIYRFDANLTGGTVNRITDS